MKESVVDEFARSHSKMSDFRELLLDISGHLTTDDVAELKFLYKEYIPTGKAQKITNVIELFSELEQLNLLSDKKRYFLASKLIAIGKELGKKLLGIQGSQFRTSVRGTIAKPLLLVTNSLISNSRLMQHPRYFIHKYDM